MIENLDSQNEKMFKASIWKILSLIINGILTFTATALIAIFAQAYNIILLYPLYFVFFIFYLFGTSLFFYKAYISIFYKVIINEKCIQSKYKNKVTQKLYWDEIKNIYFYPYPSGSIYLTNKNKEKIVISTILTNFQVLLNKVLEKTKSSFISDSENQAFRPKSSLARRLSSTIAMILTLYFLAVPGIFGLASQGKWILFLVPLPIIIPVLILYLIIYLFIPNTLILEKSGIMLSSKVKQRFIHKNDFRSIELNISGKLKRKDHSPRIVYIVLTIKNNKIYRFGLLGADFLPLYWKLKEMLPEQETIE